MPPSVVCGTVRLALAAQSQPLPPRPSSLSPQGAQLGFRDARAPRASTVPEPTGWQTTTWCVGHSFARQLSHSIHPNPKVVSSSAQLPIPEGARPASRRSYLRCAGRLRAQCRSLAPARLPGAAAVRPRAGTRASCPLPPRWGFLWGWTKDISWEERGNVPSMPRFVVHGDFLPPQQQQGPLLRPQDWRRRAHCVPGHCWAGMVRGSWLTHRAPVAESRGPADVCCVHGFTVLCAPCERPFL